MDSPLLLVPLPNEEGERINSSNLILLNVTNKKIVTPNALKDVDEEEGGYFCIVGSSHGWLAILDHKGDPFLLNPFSEARVRLPPKETLPNIDHIEQIDEYGGGGGFKIHYKNSNLPCYCYEPTSYEDILIKKVALSSNPSYGDKFTVVIMYNERLKDKMAFCRNGDDVWSGLECTDKDGYLQDIVLFSDDQSSSSTMLLFALYRQGHSVEVWNMNEPIPSRRSIIEDSYPKITNQIFQSYLYTSRLYLALSSSGEVYSVVRYVGECVDLFTGRVEEHQPGFEVTPYKTIHFHVYKLDPNQKIWAEVKSLKDTALFLGGNHSMMLSIDKYPGLMGNSIYFTDDKWDRITPDCITFGGHDLGIFNLGDGTIKPLLVLEPDPNTSFKINPPPFWLIN